MSSSSDLSSPPSTDVDAPPQKKTLKPKHGKLTFSARRKAAPARDSSPDEPEREPSPPHEYALEDNPDIAFIVMFRARFSDLFPKNVPNLGPQDIERGVSDTEPGEQIENLLCALIGLVLNRKKYVERGHHGRALEEAISTQKSQWPEAWNGINPLAANSSFQTMTPAERLTLLKTLIIWALNTSEVITGIIKESYKQTRRDDDVNQPLSVQPWGLDGRKRRYFLIEGQMDTPFRVYRESAWKSMPYTWWSLAGTIPELQAVESALRVDNSQAAKRLADRIIVAIPTLEATEEKRKKKEYRKVQRQKFVRPEPGFSLYEGRTRGKRMKYTFSDEEDDDATDTTATRRSTRHSGVDTPAENNGPMYTASGRQVRSRFPRYGEATNNSEKASPGVGDEGHEQGGRATRSGRAGGRKIVEEDDSDEDMDDEKAPSEGDEWGGDDNDVEGKLDNGEVGEEDDDDIMSDNGSNDSLMDEPRKMIVQLKYRKTLTQDASDEQPQVNGYDHAVQLGNEHDGPNVDVQVEMNGASPQQHPNSSTKPLTPSNFGPQLPHSTPPLQPSNFGPQPIPSPAVPAISVLPPVSASSRQAKDLLQHASHPSPSTNLPHTSLPGSSDTQKPSEPLISSILDNSAAGPVLEGQAPAMISKSATSNGILPSSTVGPILEGPAPTFGSNTGDAYTRSTNGLS